jgi:hypothetical protein
MTRNLRHGLAMLAALGLIFSGVFLIASQSAYANETPALDMMTATTCSNLEGWSPNPDEKADRSPESKPEGLEFSNTDLTHHETDLKLADLKPGSFVASKTPDQPSFFSVEITDADGAYGTLRWNPSEGTSGEWDLVTNLGQFHHADPADFIGTATKWGLITETARVFSFGVGYTEHPAGTVTTVVSSVTFNGHTYDLTCLPETETSSPAPHSSSTSAAPHSSTAKPHSSSSAPVAGGTGSLPVTGPPVGLIVGGAVALFVLGGGALYLSRRRRTTFQA